MVANVAMTLNPCRAGNPAASIADIPRTAASDRSNSSTIKGNITARLSIVSTALSTRMVSAFAAVANVSGRSRLNIRTSRTSRPGTASLAEIFPTLWEAGGVPAL